MQENEAISRVHLCQLGNKADDVMSAVIDDVMSELLVFDVSKAHCYDPNEENKLMKVIAGVGIARFHERIRNLAKLYIESQQTNKPHFVSSRVMPLIKS